MRMFNRFSVAIFIFVLSAASFVRSQSSNFQQELQAGITALEAGSPENAIQHLERAAQLNPGSVQSHLALARAYRAEYKDEMETDDEEAVKANNRLLDRAIDEFKAVVRLDPSNTEALNNLGSIYRWLAKFDEAELYFRQSLRVNPNEQQALYSLAFLNWQRSYQFRMERRSDLQLKSRTPLIRHVSCADVRSKNLAQVEEAITLLSTLSQFSDFAEVPYFLSLLYRERADIQCGDEAAYDSDLRSAKEWEEGVCTARTRKAEHVPYPWPAAPAPPPHLKCN